MAIKPESITHILDIEGFYVGGQFVFKEAAIVDVKTSYVFKAEFILNENFHDLSPGDQRTAKYLLGNVHGIPFKNYGYEKYEQRDMNLFISSAINSHESPVVGYKGGQIERKVLSELGVADFNLENIGCPKFKTLLEDGSYNKYRIIRCRLHKYKLTYSGDKIHCSAEEVQIFRNWLRKYVGTD